MTRSARARPGVTAALGSRRKSAAGRFDRWMAGVEVAALRDFADRGKVTALVPLIFDASVDMPFVVPKAVVSQGLSLVLAAVLFGAVLRFGRAIVISTPLHVPVLMFLLVSGLAAALASNETLALVGTHARMLGFTSLVDGVVLYGAVAILIRTRAAAVAIGAATLLASVAVISVRGPSARGAGPVQLVN